MYVLLKAEEVYLEERPLDIYVLLTYILYLSLTYLQLNAEEVYLEELSLDDLKLVCNYLLPDWKIAQRIPLLLDGLHPQEQIGPATSPHSRPRSSAYSAYLFTSTKVQILTCLLVQEYKYSSLHSRPRYSAYLFTSTNVQILTTVEPRISLDLH